MKIIILLVNIFLAFSRLLNADEFTKPLYPSRTILKLPSSVNNDAFLRCCSQFLQNIK